MGTGYAEGPDRAMSAVTQALESPLLDSSSIRGTKDILLNIISGTDEITMGEIGEIIDFLQDEAGQDATIIWGNGCDPKLGNQISVTIIATGFDVNPNRIFQNPGDMVELEPENTGFEINLDDDESFFSKEFAAPEPEKKPAMETQMHKGSSGTQKKAGKVKPEKPKPDNATVDSWFTRQFTKLFDDKDSTIPEENSNN
jgi:cell division protein FtsZ